MKTRLPPALAILGAALLLSSTEAEEKLPLLLRFVHFPALKCSSFVFCLTHSVQCCVVSLRLSLRCAVHTATYAAAFQEDQLSVGRGRRLLPGLPTGYLQVLPRSPGSRTGLLE
uniref:Collagen type XII alpha 1 chain n=1 Tax=Myotis myotis TaxID=51298 RepID=A0A7J7WUR8_MYOMY|nr:collagen type XII alpha 1 chain [Myotis myotis]